MADPALPGEDLLKKLLSLSDFTPEEDRAELVHSSIVEVRMGAAANLTDQALFRKWRLKTRSLRSADSPPTRLHGSKDRRCDSEWLNVESSVSAILDDNCVDALRWGRPGPNSRLPLRKAGQTATSARPQAGSKTIPGFGTELRDDAGEGHVLGKTIPFKRSRVRPKCGSNPSAVTSAIRPRFWD